MPHEPFPIADFQDGLLLPKEPWISPRNAFRELEDAYVFRGRVLKRQGFDYFAELAEGAADIAGLYNGLFLVLGVRYNRYRPTVPNINDKPNIASVWFRSDNGVAGAPYINGIPDMDSLGYDDTSGSADFWQVNIVDELDPSIVIGWSRVWVEPTTSSSFYWHDAAVAWELHSGYSAQPTNDGEMFYRTNPRSEVVGLFRFSTTTGEFSLAADQDYLYRYNATSGYYEEQGGVLFDAPRNFSGSDEDYFWFWPFDDYVLFTNGVDPVCRWTPGGAAATSVSEQPTDFDAGAPGNDIRTALLVIRFKGRAVYLNTTEGGGSVLHPRRARFSSVGAYDVFDSPLDFLDAPAELGDIVTAQFIGERCFVGFEEGWMELSQTGDFIAPFEFLPFISRFGASAKLSIIRDNERLLTRSDTSIQALDPNGQYYFDEEIPDLVRGFSPSKTALSSGVRVEDRRAFWWSYVPSNQLTPNKVLNATYDEQGQVAWSIFNLSFNVFSSFATGSSPSWDSLGPKTWDDYTGVTWNDARIGEEGFVKIIGGSGEGTIYTFSVSNTDDYITGRVPITLNFETQELSPYPGMKAHMGWIDLFLGGLTDGALTLDFYIDKEVSPRKRITLDLTPEAGKSKKYIRCPIGVTGTFHRITGTSSDGKATAIDAMIPYFRPAGRTKEF